MGCLGSGKGEQRATGEETERRMPDGGFSVSVVLGRYPARELDQQGRNGKMIPGTSSVFGGKECQTRLFAGEIREVLASVMSVLGT